MLKKIRVKAIVPTEVTAKEDIRAGFHEVLVDLNQIIDQWNDTLQPLVDSLPGGRRRLTSQDRTQTIDPVLNGFDGSEVFMDMTATPVINNGMLYNLSFKRPKTIKEVVLDSHADLLQQIRQLRSLVDSIDALAGTEYDDTDLRNWVRRLAANTVSDLNEGDTFDAGYFVGNLPTKTVEYSLHQRDSNLRLVVGLDGDYSVVAPDFTGTTHIVDDTNIIDALITLDGLVDSGTNDTLQTAYDNGDGVINLGLTKPFYLFSIDSLTPAMTIAQILTSPAIKTQGSIISYDGEDVIGYFGSIGQADTFHIFQGAGKTLSFGDEVGMINYCGRYHNIAIFPDQGSPGSLAGVRYINHNDDSIAGGVAMENYHFEQQPSQTPTPGAVSYVAASEATGYSPKGTFNAAGETLADPIDDVTYVGPNAHRTYKDNTVKMTFNAPLDYYNPMITQALEGISAANTSHNVMLTPIGTVDLSYRTAYDPASGEGFIRLLTPIDPAYSINAYASGISGKVYQVATHTPVVVSSRIVGFYFKVYEWKPGSTTWGIPEDNNFLVNFQVI